MRSFVMDGNFAQEHLKSRRPEDDVLLADGTGYMVAPDEYQQHLDVTPDEKVVRVYCAVMQVRDNDDGKKSLEKQLSRSPSRHPEQQGQGQP